MVNNHIISVERFFFGKREDAFFFTMLSRELL